VVLKIKRLCQHPVFFFAVSEWGSLTFFNNGLIN